MRIHVWIAAMTGLSRRKAEALVNEGRVEINGKLAKIGETVEKGAEIIVDGKRIREKHQERLLVALHKPLGYECSRCPSQNHLSVFELLPKLSAGKWVLVGRLDVNTSGLLLATTDGKLANTLAHPSSDLEREYLVRVSNPLQPESLRALLTGVVLEDGEARASVLKPHRQSKGGRNTWYNIVLKEGRNRIVRRLMESQGVTVSRLMRVRFGPIKLDKALGVGKHQMIDAQWLEKQIKKGNN